MNNLFYSIRQAAAAICWVCFAYGMRTADSNDLTELWMEAAFPLQKGLSRNRFTNLLSIPLKVSSSMQCKSHIFAF